jgi:hypothetical protein
LIRISGRHDGAQSVRINIDISDVKRVVLGRAQSACKLAFIRSTLVPCSYTHSAAGSVSRSYETAPVATK